MGLFGKPFVYKNDMKRNRGGPYKTEAATDLTRWRLTSTWGRQVWSYLTEEESTAKPQTLWEKHYLGLDIVCNFVYCSLHGINVIAQSEGTYFVEKYTFLRFYLLLYNSNI